MPRGRAESHVVMNRPERSSEPTKPVEVALANNDRVTLRLGDTYLKVDSNHERSAVEAAAIALAPVPTPEVLWHKPPVLALTALEGRTLGRLGEPSTASPAAWAAVGRALRELHEAPLPPWPGRSQEDLALRIATECNWFATNRVLPDELLHHARNLAERVVRPFEAAFIHGDLHLEHVFVNGDTVSGFIDWSEASQGDPLFDIASLTLANEERLGDLLAGYGQAVDHQLIRSWWACRCLLATRWLSENGYGSPDELPEVAVLRSLR